MPYNDKGILGVEGYTKKEMIGHRSHEGKGTEGPKNTEKKKAY